MKRMILAVMAAGCLMGCPNANRQGAAPEVREDNNPVLSPDVTVVDTDNADAVEGLHTAVNSLDYAGTYKGVLPCADCGGIETVITLNDDGTYKMSTKYMDKNDNTYVSEGNYRWESDGTRLRLMRDGEPAMRYFVGEGYLYQLDMDGNRVEGSLAEHYRLDKQ